MCLFIWRSGIYVKPEVKILSPLNFSQMKKYIGNRTSDHFKNASLVWKDVKVVYIPMNYNVHWSFVEVVHANEVTCTHYCSLQSKLPVDCKIAIEANCNREFNSKKIIWKKSEVRIYRVFCQ